MNRKFAKALVGLAPESVEFVEIPIKDLPVYNRDLDADYPAEAVAFKDALKAVDALLYVTPEYNRSIPGSLKNAIDWASRPYGQGGLTNPSAIAGVSGGPIGTAVAQSHLRQILGFFSAVLYGQPELYIQWTEELLTPDDSAFAEGNVGFFQGWMDGFVAFLEKQLG